MLQSLATLSVIFFWQFLAFFKKEKCNFNLYTGFYIKKWPKISIFQGEIFHSPDFYNRFPIGSEEYTKNRDAYILKLSD
jgi:hypothetical protein